MSDLLLQHIGKHVDLLQEQSQLVLSKFKTKKLRKHEYLIRAGEVCKYETFITKGCLKAYTLNEEGVEHIAFFGVENWYIGDLYSFLTGLPSTLYISALEDCDMLQIDKPTLDSLLEEVPVLEKYFRILFQNAFVATQSRVMNNIAIDASQRYDLFLKRYPDLPNRMPQYLIASYLGITPQFLSKIRRSKR